ncbi:hypothetical protein, conserved [Trypanosoma brucei brucei TREU927]|uniref:Uncharacterized protein n=2 Tax=Trypanosoma brucei TaxID=5691 RepID=Q57Y15_TRYB2|nr:hypothetical protein, conserved [Trypanosoma brucei brucei TREU927]AAX69519.1 hypothetical protein, conserved [Trypanosoma brucei]AAX80107.1 hypothetical protein Tb04.30K5.490 [Trypanosoma brucei]AAZ11002.1 hypothetical protein, conserved [Trypanosoma brucei brucei TREU927]
MANTALLEREYALPPMGELCLATASSGGAATVTLLAQVEDGGEEPRAEIFGTELSTGVVVHLPVARSLAVFSPTGCRLVLTASSAVHQICYGTTCNATRARSVADIHTHLEVQRVKARRTGADGIGPHVLFVAERRAVGTSTYVRTLINYAVRLGYHPLLLDASVEAPRFGYPGVVSLYAMQYTIDIENEMAFVPGLHSHQGTKKHEDPALFLHILRQMMRLSTERMARSDRCRVGGIFVDYGTISRAVVEDAEAWECAEEKPEGRPKVNPLDVLVSTILAAGIDHVFVVGSSWLRFKIAQRLHQESGAQSEIPQITPSTITCSNGLKVQLFLLDSTECGAVPDDAFFNRQCWLQYFFGSRTMAVKPTLFTVDASLIRLVTIGRGDTSGTSTFMPMIDDDSDHQDPTVSGQADVALTYVHPQDVDIKNRVLALSTATEQEELPDGTLQRIPFAVFESRLKRGLLMGFALVESVTAGSVTLLTNAAGIRKDIGLCFIVTDQQLMAQADVEPPT